MLTTTPRTLSYKLASYFSSLWNVFDVVVIVFMVISIILRYSLEASNFIWARRVYAITLVLYYLRFLYIFYVSKNIGPKVIMIRRMVSCFVLKGTYSSRLLSFTGSWDIHLTYKQQFFSDNRSAFLSCYSHRCHLCLWCSITNPTISKRYRGMDITQRCCISPLLADVWRTHAGPG